MIVTPLPGRGVTAIRDALLSHGWEGDVCRDTALGIDATGFHVTGVSRDTIEAMLPVAGRLGLELVTGDNWVLLAGAQSRLGAFARSWVQPEAVRDLSTAIGMAMPFEMPTTWSHAGGLIRLDSPVVIGVINVTPDSFSDRVATIAPNDALRQVEALLEGGATVVDVGGESTRPGAEPVDAATERDRVVPVIAAIAQRFPDLPLSIDTVRAETARAGLDAGAVIINDVTAGRHDPSLLTLAASTAAGLVLSHSRGALGELASFDHADFGGDVTGVVLRELGESLQAALAAGVSVERIVLDPGFGFGKTADQNFRLLDDLDAFVRLGRPVLAGVSRKRFIGVATGRTVGDRDRATAAACAIAVDRGARLLRVHDPAATRDAIALAESIRASRA